MNPSEASYLNLMEDLERRRQEAEKLYQEASEKTAELKKAQSAQLNIMEDLERRRQEVEARERQLKETQEMLVQAGKLTALGQLGAGIAHELNQPIAAIMGFSQLLLTQVSADSPLVGNLKVIEEQSQRMAKIVDNIRSFAREGAGDREKVNLNEAIDSALMLMATQLKAHRINLEVVAEPSLPAVWANKNQVQQIFINLFTNARDAIEEKGAGGTIRVTTRSDKKGWCEVRVSDTGVGIPEAARARIFDPFFTTKPPGKGTGLGLSILYGILQAHKGTIDVESTPGQGATFIVRLPVGK